MAGKNGTLSLSNKLIEKIHKKKLDFQTEPFPVCILSEDDPLADHCARLFRDINKSWELLVAAALGYPY